MSERLSFHLRVMSRAAAAVIIAGCGTDGGEVELVQPNVTAAIVLEELEGQSNEYATAYGMGLSVGCNPEELLEDGQTNLGPRAQATYNSLLEQNTQDTLNGFKAGLERGLAEQSREESAVC